MDKTVCSNINRLINDSGKIIILTHHNPDGDAVGSCLGLYHLLVNMGKKVNVVTPNDFPDFLKWLDGVDSIIKFSEDETGASGIIMEADLIFNLDFNYKNRLGKIEPVLEKSGAKKILIDHHPRPEDFNDLILSDINVSSTCELLFDFIITAGFQKLINTAIAECLLTGMMTDTISFTVNCNRAKTFSSVAALLDYGADVNKIHSCVFNNFSTSRMRLLGHCLNNKMVVLPKYRTAYISISKNEIKKYHFRKGDSEGIVNYPLSIRNIDLAVLFIEKPDQIKLSLRSKNGIKVNEFAEKYFNGGGHKNAAGGESYIALDKTIELFLRLLPELKDYQVKE